MKKINKAMSKRKIVEGAKCLCETCCSQTTSTRILSLVKCICDELVIDAKCQREGKLCTKCRENYPIYQKNVQLVGFNLFARRTIAAKVETFNGTVVPSCDRGVDDIIICKTQKDVDEQHDDHLSKNVFLWEVVELKLLDDNKETQSGIVEKKRALSDYEILRQTNIQRNEKYLTCLIGIPLTKSVQPLAIRLHSRRTPETEADQSSKQRRSRRSTNSIMFKPPRWTLHCPFGECLPITSDGDDPIIAMRAHFNRGGCTKEIARCIYPARIDAYYNFLTKASEESRFLDESDCVITYPEFEDFFPNDGGGGGGDDGGLEGEIAVDGLLNVVEADKESGSEDLSIEETPFLQTIHQTVKFTDPAINFEFILPEDTDDGDVAFVLPDVPLNPIPSEIVFELQIRLMLEYGNKKQPIRARNLKRTRKGLTEVTAVAEVAVNPDNLARFYHHCVSHNIREGAADKLLRLIRDMGAACDTVIPMPSTYRAIKKSCGKSIPKLFQIQRIDIPLQPNFIFKQHKEELKPTIGVSMCILEVLAKALLEIQPSSFITEPPETNGQTSLRDFTTGSYFAAICRALKDEFGEMARPLILAVTLDKTTLNSTRTQSACPVCLYIMNAIGQFFKPIFLAYAPIELAYDEDELVVILGDIGVNLEKWHTALFKIAKRRAMNDFLFHVLSPILQFQQTGMHVAVGQKGAVQKEAVVFPHYSHFMGDNEQQDSLCQVSNRGLRHQCRGCNQDKCGGLDNCYPAVGTVRSDRLNAFLSEAAERLHVELIDACIKKLCTPQWSNSKCKVWEAANFWNIKPGLNRLYDLIQWQSIRGLNSFHQMFPADFLHTFLKGLIENLISWCLIIIEAVGDLDTNFTNQPIALDRIIKLFPIHEMPLVRMVKFPRGLRYCLKLTTTTKKLSSGTNFLSGGFEAWKLASMMVQLLFSVGSSGTYCPNDPTWYESCLLPALNRGLEEKKKHTTISNLLIGRSVNQVIVNSMSSALQCLFYLKSGSFSDIQLDTVSLLLKNARIHHARVFKLKFLICAALRLQSRDFEEEKQFAGTKIHHLMHYVTNMKRLGGITQSWDTEMSELFHKTVGKAAFESSSKTKKGMLEEMVRYVQKRDHAQALLMRVLKCTKGSTNCSDLRNEDSGLDNLDSATFEHSSNTGKQLIRFMVVDGLIERIKTGVIKIDKRKLFLHGLIQLTDVVCILRQFVKDRPPEDSSNIVSFLSGRMPTAHLVPNLKWKQIGSNHVILRSNPEFKNDSKEFNTQKFPVFSSINCRFSEGVVVETAKIVAIIKFSDLSIILIVLPYKARSVQTQLGETNFYSCENLSYKTKKGGGLDFKAISSHDIVSEAFVCPNIDTQPFRATLNTFNTKWRFHSVPYLQARPATQVHETYLTYSQSFPQTFQCETEMTILESFAISGSRVVCNQYDMGLWLEGKITGTCAIGTFEVLFDFSPVKEDKRERNVPLSRLRFNVKGGRVCWRNHLSQVWSMGTIISPYGTSVTILSDIGIKNVALVNEDVFFIGQHVDILPTGTRWKKGYSIVNFSNPELCVVSKEDIESTVALNTVRFAIEEEHVHFLPWHFVVDLPCYASWRGSTQYYYGKITSRSIEGGAYHITFVDGDIDNVPPGKVDFRVVQTKVCVKIRVKQASTEKAINEWTYGTITDVDWDNDIFTVKLKDGDSVKVAHDSMLYVGKRVHFEKEKWIIRKLHCRRGLCDIIKCVSNEIRERISPTKLKPLKLKQTVDVIPVD